MNKGIIYFLVGVFFVSFYDIIISWLEYLKIKPSKKILKGNVELENLRTLIETQLNEAYGYDVVEDDEE